MSTENQKLAPGVVIDGRARLLRLLGRGGMGDVWAAQHLKLYNEIAVKILSRRFAADAEAVARFKREAQAVASIKSPYVVRIFDYGLHDGTPYLMMELLEGETLRDRIKREGRLTIDETRRIVKQTCKALTQAHSLGIVHRDLKPANIFLSSSGDETFVKLLDFGIAKLLGAEPLTATGIVIGSILYMSPEQIGAPKTIDHRADLFSLAVVTYAMLTGVEPFSGDTDSMAMIAIIEGKFVPPSKHRADLPRALDAWFERALAVEREARPQSAAELAESFARALVAPDPIVAPAAPLATAILFPETKPAASLEASVSNAKTLVKRPSLPARSSPLVLWIAVGVIVFGVGAVVVVSVAVFWLLAAKPAQPTPPPTIVTEAAPVPAPPPVSVAAPAVSEAPTATAPSAASTPPPPPARPAPQPKRSAEPPASAPAPAPAPAPTGPKPITPDDLF